MNQAPHIGVTLAQRASLRHRIEREREAELSVAELMSRFQPQPANFCALDDEIAQARHDWLLAIVVGTLGAPLVWHLMGWLLPLVWSAK